MTLLKLHLGCGHHRLEGWENHDIEVDVRKKLPWEANSAKFIMCEHLVEHITFDFGVRFLRECRRVLHPEGILRFSFPDAERLVGDRMALAVEWLKTLDLEGEVDDARVFRTLFTCWGHKSAWTPSLAKFASQAGGFTGFRVSEYGVSVVADLTGIEGHHLVAGPIAEVETTVIEAYDRDAIQAL